MSPQRSFTDYVSSSFYDEIFDAVSRFVVSHRHSLGLWSNTVADIRYAQLSDFQIRSVGVDDLPGDRIAFTVVVEAEIEVQGNGRRDYESDNCYQWFSIVCNGDLSLGLSDFKITRVEAYNQKLFNANPLSDALVPYMHADKLEDVATDFLSRYYPEALRTPQALDTTELAKRMGLTVVVQQLAKDFSVFGQIIFADTDAEVYDYNRGEMVTRHFNAGTVVVDPQTFLLRNLGSVNNTIVHECVHWDKHKKAFQLERLYNSSATQIKCIVVGGIQTEKNRSANDWMEWQANSLAPRIQMPIGAFKQKANELIRKYQRDTHTSTIIDVMEPVIDELAAFFVVSRCAAKIRMVDAGYEEAIGTFTYVDGHYVKPHAFKRGSLAKNQTYSISMDDAVVEMLWNKDIRPKALSGDYTYVDSHVCLNRPKYIEYDSGGIPAMTEYARLHMDECCLAFTLKATHTNKYGEQFYKECVLYRDVNSGLHFEAHFAPESSADVMAKADALSEVNKEIMTLKMTLPLVFSDSLVRIMEWAEVTVEQLAEDAKVSSKTIQRMRTKADYNVNMKTVIAICVGMHLHPILSQHLIESAGLVFRYVSEEQMMYHFFITAYYTHTVDECNALLQAKGFKILSGEE